MKPKVLLLLSLLFTLFACSKEEAFAPMQYAVSGRVEKGPLVSGSTVTLESLDSKLHPFGSPVTTTIKDDEGSFDWTHLRLNSPYALLTAKGHFYDELRGELSLEPVTLQAIVDLSAQSTVNINLLTHFKTERLRWLIASGRSFAASNQQAQAELFENFALQRYAATDASQFSIAAGTDEAAALIIISAALLKDRTEADFAKYITRLTKEFAFGGTFSEAVKRQFQQSTIGLRSRLSDISNYIVKRYKEQGRAVTVKDLAYYIDWNEDGVAGNELGDPNVTKKLEFETTELTVPKRGGTFRVKINANVPYSLTDPVGSANDDFYRALPSNSLFKESTITYRRTAEQDVLTVTVGPASNKKLRNEAIHLYSMDGRIGATLSLKQEGDPTKQGVTLTDLGKRVFITYSEYVAIVLSYLHTEEALYTRLYQTSDSSWKKFMRPPLDAYHTQMSNGWELAMLALKNSRQATYYMTDPYALNFTPYLACADAVMYYEMAVLWGNVVYLKHATYDDKANRQLTEKELFAQLEVPLKEGIATFDEKRNRLESVSDMFSLSKDVPRALLAKMYLYNKEYSSADALFKEIVQTGHYRLESSRSRAMANGSNEMIYGLFAPRVSTSDSPFYYLERGDDRLPSVTYTEVLLSLAECAYQLGDEPMGRSYLNEVMKARGLSFSNVNDNFIASLQKVWAGELKGTGTYFAFLKRNNLAQTVLNLEAYMLLLPIPQWQLHVTPTTKQNPGYTR